MLDAVEFDTRQAHQIAGTFQASACPGAPFHDDKRRPGCNAGEKIARA
jgi:hypothetical protein